MRPLLTLVALTSVALAQVPTRIGQHQIGETLQDWYRLEPQQSTQPDQPSAIGPHKAGETFFEWLRLNNLDLGEICGKHKRSDRDTDYKAVCKKLSLIEESGAGEFYTNDQSRHTFGWRFQGGKVVDYSVDGQWQSNVPDQTSLRPADETELVTTRNNRSYRWKFKNGRLSSVSVTPDWAAIYKQYSEEGIARHPEVVPAFHEDVDFLTQTYGKPSQVLAVPYQNAFGAHWERSRVIWNAPDGTQIVAFERTGFNQEGQLELVSFLSKEALNEGQQTKPNPYK